MKHIFSQVEVLSPGEIDQIHQGALRIVSRVGLKLPNHECLQACAAHGAQVDWERQVFTIAPPVMEDFLTRLKNTFPPLAPKSQLKKLQGYISPQVFWVDYGAKARRLGLMEDNLRGIAVLEKLGNILGSGSIVVPADVPAYLSDILTFQLMFKYARQGGGTYVLSPTSAKYIIQIHQLMGVTTGYLFSTVSPLQFSKEHIDIAMVFLKHGYGLTIGPMPIGGISAPVTIAGILAMQTAEALASLFAVHALTGSFAPFTVAGHSMDLRSMLCSFGSPNQGLLGIATAQMARYYGYEGAWTNSGLTDSLLPDFQGGFEKALTSAFSLLGGATNMGCQGIVGADQGISLEQLVLDNEWIAAFNHIVEGVEVSEETLGIDLIEQIGIGGSFVNQEHTAQHMRLSYWMSKLFNRQAWDGWRNAGQKSAFDKAHDFVEECLRSNYPHEPILPIDRADQLDQIVQAAVEELTFENR